jgi:hypothetical protein
MERERRNQAYDTLGHSLRNGSQVRVAKRRKACESIDAAGELLQFPGVPHLIEDTRMNAGLEGLAGSQCTTVLFEHCLGACL